ncbi:NAD(P)/FAD-dependent oxidoreductase [Aureitalea marina]|uniref:NADH:ubiquinone reductase (non-electrogenic) n=1 Tax=Aureitalea marina TaxID=930804 RepID=A0A2S7KPU7_9FLAO|nr:NAD(P)/FAD-dependent oxidoreductase [Aureitalea marina]PQB04641.1 FAD-dependent oxidoreductase [Aureitalea marina]
MNIPATDLPRIVVIGGGFAGISAIRQLTRVPAQIVLFDRHNYHTFQPLLYQVSTAGLEPDSIAYPLRKVFRKHKDFHFRMAQVERIDPEKKTILTNIGTLSYDYLIIATGTKTNYFGNAQIERNSMPMKTVAQALDIRSLMLQNIEKADREENASRRKQLLTFVIAGAGPTGVELAGALAEFRKGILGKDYQYLDRSDMRVVLIEGSGRVLVAMSEFASKKSQQFLERMGVEVLLNTLVTDYDQEVVKTQTGQEIPAATFIWSAGVTGNSVAGLHESAYVPRANRYPVNAFNEIEGMEQVYALGDVALMKTERYPNGHPQVAQPAIQQGKNLGKNLVRHLAGKPMRAFRYFDKGTMATIGRNKAVCDIGRYRFSGFFAWMVWMFVHLWFLVGFRNRVITFFNWTYNYINYDRAARLIIRPFKRKAIS